MIVDSHPPTAVVNMIREGVDGILILSDENEIHEEIAGRFPDEEVIKLLARFSARKQKRSPEPAG